VFEAFAEGEGEARSLPIQTPEKAATFVRNILGRLHEEPEAPIGAEPDAAGPAPAPVVVPP
jgi:hypothetical protein